MLQKLRQLDWVLLALILLGARSVYDANISQALIVMCFTGLVGFTRWLASKKQPDMNASVMEELNKMKNTIGNISMKNVKRELPENIRLF